MSNTTAQDVTAQPQSPAVRMSIANDDLTLLPIGLLLSDQNYQRGLKQAHINTIADDFNRLALTPPIVVQRRDGSYWLIDGQQRVEALRRMNRFTHIYVQLVKNITIEEEAELFVAVNSCSKALNATELYKACNRYGTNVATAIEAELNRHELTAALGSTGNEIRAIGKLLEAWGPNARVQTHLDLSTATGRNQFEEGRRVLRWAISVGLPLIQRNFPANKVYQGNILGALIWIRRNHKSTNMAKVRSVLSKVDNPDMLRFEITKTNTSAGGSRRSLHGARLAYWVNSQAKQPFIRLHAEEWLPLNIEDGIDVTRDPNVLLVDEDLGFSSALADAA